MSKIIQYLDNQSEIQLFSNTRIKKDDIRTTDLLFLMRGKAKLTIDEKAYIMRVDDFIVINRHENYEIIAEKDSLLFYFSISPFLLAQALEVEKVSFYCNSIENPNKNYDTLRRLVIEIIDLLIYENDKTNFLQMSKVYHLLNELSSLFLEQTMETLEEDQRIQKITRTIKERYYENLTLTTMSELVHMDIAYFSKFFKKNMNKNFKDYLSDVRMQHALQDLTGTEKSITQIAIDNGFFSVNGFNKKFKELYQTTPSDYRKKHQKHKVESTHLLDDKVKDSFLQYKLEKEDVVSASKSYYQFEMNLADKKPVPETWGKILNIGAAEMVLNNSLRRQLSTLQQNLTFTYGRIWEIFTPRLLGESFDQYDMIDEIIDTLINLGLTPWISLNKISHSFKESDYSKEKWQAIIHNFCLHLSNRYGTQTVSNWNIEIVANMPENPNSISHYCSFYQMTYAICKQLLPNITVGGGTFVLTNNFDVNAFIKGDLAECSFDFFSFALFPYSNRLVREKRNYQRVTDPDFFKSQVQALKQIDTNKPIYISEWGNTVSRSNLLNDSLYKGAFIIKSLIDMFDQVDGLGYWLSTDLVQKSTQNKGLLTGGNGLLNKNGLFKPAMHAMKFFDQLHGSRFQYKDERHLVCSSEENEFFILGHHYIHPNSLYYLKDESKLKVTEVNQFFEEVNYEEEIVLSNISNGTYELRVFSCLKDHGDLFNQWSKLNFIQELRSSDIKYLEEKSTHLQTLEVVSVTQNRLVINKKLASNEFYEINIKKRR
jgi:xylan 1,4-beta-xylosidase